MKQRRALISGLVRGRFLRSVVSTGDSSGGTWSSSSVSCPLTVASKAIDPLHVTSCDAINFLSAMLEDKQTVTI